MWTSFDFNYFVLMYKDKDKKNFDFYDNLNTDTFKYKTISIVIYVLSSFIIPFCISNN